MKESLKKFALAVASREILLDEENLPRAKRAHKEASREYFEEGESGLTDEEFDLLEKRIRKADPGWVPPVGAEVAKKVERPLVVECPSLDKMQAENPKAVERFLGKFRPGQRLVVSAKIDGASLLAHYQRGTLSSLSTRGDGTNGKSIDGYIEVARRKETSVSGTGLVVDLHGGDELALRYEVAMRSSLFRKKWSNEFASARVVSSSAFNRSVPNAELLADMDYVLIGGFVKSGGKWQALSYESLEVIAARNKIKRPFSSVVCARDLSVQVLSKKLEEARSQKEGYELDGLVVSPWEVLERFPSSDNPEFSRAFKDNDIDNAIPTVIEEIVWKVSSHGKIVPKAKVTPVKFGGVTVTHAALHNVQWAQERGAGVGAKVRIIRSGEIIPKIVFVDKPATFRLPSKSVIGEYERNGVNLVVSTKQGNARVAAQKIGRMFNVLGLDQLGSGLAEKMVAEGFDTTSKVALMSLADVSSLPGIKGSAAKIHSQIARIRSGEYTAGKLLLASGVCNEGVGSRVIDKIESNCPDLLTSKVVQQDILRLSEFVGPAVASTIGSAWPQFREWMKEVQPSVARITKAVKVNGKLSGQCFSWTGYRSEEEENYIKQNGGEIVPFGKRTNVLFYRKNGKASGKVAAAGSRAKEFSNWKSHT